MSPADRFGQRRVNSGVRVLSLTLATCLFAACGGGSSSGKKQTTPPPLAREDDVLDDPSGRVADPDPVETLEGGGPVASGPAPQDIDPVEPAPPPPPPKEPELPKKEPVKPPGQELSPERKAAIVGDALRKGAQAIRSRDSDRAINEAKVALNADETNVEAMVILAHAYYLKEFDDKAMQILKIAQSRPEGQSHALGWMLSGLIHDRANKESDALSAYETAFRIKPDYIGALNNAGVIYLKRKRYKDAVDTFERVIQYQSNNPRARSHLGAAYRGRSADTSDPAERDQDLQRAERELKTAMSQDPTYAPAYFNLGILYLDAEPAFPGLETLLRYQNAQRYLTEYKRLAGPKLIAAVEDYLTAAQKGYDREKRALEKKKKQQEKERNKPKTDPPAEGGQP